MTVSPPRRRWAALGAVLGAVLGGVLLAGSLAGCTPLQAGAAAVVGDNTLTESDVTAIVDEVEEVAATQEEPTPVADGLTVRIVGIWVEEELTEELARRQGVSITDGEVDRFLSQFGDADRAAIAVQTGIPPSGLERAARTALLRQQLLTQLAPDVAPEDQNAALVAAFAELVDDVGVSVNPRFGQWDADLGQVVPPAQDRLSSPAPSDDAPLDLLPGDGGQPAPGGP